jgi:hypothetical protein
MSCSDQTLYSLYITSGVLTLLLVISEWIGWSSCHYGGIIDFIQKKNGCCLCVNEADINDLNVIQDL